MKKLSLLAILLCLLGTAAHAATISGTVTNSTTMAVVSGQKMILFDPVTSFKDSAYTNTSGYYSITIPSTVPTFDSLKISTTACGSVMSYWPLYMGSNLTVNFMICVSAPPPPPTTYALHGTVTLSGAANTGVAKLWLIRKQYDSTLMDTTLTAIDSFNTASTGGTYTSTTYSSVPYGKLLLKAALLSSHPQYSNYMPTYYTSSIIWSGATSLSASNFTSTTATNITMTAGTNPGGSGFISGSVLLGAGKGTAVGDALPGRILLLTTSANVPVAYTYSNATGKFSFSNLAPNTYKIFGDVWSKINPALTFTLTSVKPGITNIIFEENSKKFEGRFGALGVSNTALEGLSVYPNPVGNEVFVSGLDAIGGTKAVVLRDVRGATLLSQSFGAGQTVKVATATLPQGMYLLQLQTEAGTANFRIVK